MKNEKKEEKAEFPQFFKNEADGKVLKRKSAIEVVVFQLLKTKQQIKFTYMGLKLSKEEIDKYLRLYIPCEADEYKATVNGYRSQQQRLIDNISNHL